MAVEGSSINAGEDPRFGGAAGALVGHGGALCWSDPACEGALETSNLRALFACVSAFPGCLPDWRCGTSFWPLEATPAPRFYDQWTAAPAVRPPRESVMTAIFARIRARIICSRQRELRAAFRRHRTLKALAVPPR